MMKDDMKKEGRVWKPPMIFFFVLAALFPLVLLCNQLKTIEILLGQLLFIAIGCYFLYAYLYAVNYQVVVSADEIVLSTLFRSTRIELKEIDSYTCKRYRKTKFYEFRLLWHNKKTIVYTRFKDNFEAILESNGALLQ